MERHRAALSRLRIPNARTVGAMSNGQRISYVGMVICRQRPGTASGVTFFTLEDETGFVNVVVWRNVFERYILLAKTASLLGVRGHLQTADGVTHLVAEHLWAPLRHGRNEVAPASRDFH